ncbi:single-stranded DNA-binding protein [Candidatus Collierbacteria bacterium]|nr:single-stranded DNA-binding protein [Candidatus Collierbacteria bacterium]
MSARSLNRVMLIGNLTRDPELRYTPQGTAVCTFGLATNREWTDASGTRQEEVEFHRIVAWSKLAEICSQLLYKGRKVYVQGRLQTRSWQGQDGQDKQVTEVVIDEMIALGEPKGNQTVVDEVFQSSSSSMEVDESGQVFVPEEIVGEGEGDKVEDKKEEKKEKKSGKKSKAEEVADDIPF